MRISSLLVTSIILACSAPSMVYASSASLSMNEAVQYNVSTEAFQSLRERWAESFLGDATVPFDVRLQNMVITTNNAAKKHWDSMTFSEGAVWADLPLDNVTETGRKSLGANIRTSYQRLFVMAKAYRLRYGEWQNNPVLLEKITQGLRFLNTHYYKAGVKEWGNWWHWELGTPKDVHNILALLYEVLPSDVITSHLAATRYFTPMATHLGAGAGADVSSNPNYRESMGGNRTDNTQVVLLRGILSQDEDEITQAIAALSPVVAYVSESDGFYSDGSFIQHYDIAYNGTYGNVLLGGLGAQMSLMAGSPWAVTDPTLNEIYPIIFKSYAPLLFKGSMMEFVNGRAISRPKEQGHDVGHSVLASLFHYLDGAPMTYQLPLKTLLKTHITQDTYRNFFDSINHVGNYQKAQLLLADEAVPVEDAFDGLFPFPSMDRLTYRKGDWAFSLAMHSSRLGNFECMNRENRKGWFTGDGMGYLYNGQLDHYQDYWPVVDSYALEGTTVDDQTMTPCEGQRNQIKGERKQDMDWVGMVALDGVGAAGMDFYNWDETVTAKKSWFFFDEGVIHLGSDIQSQLGANVSTAIINRKFDLQASPQLWVNQSRLDEPLTEQPVKHLLLTGLEEKNTNIGYVFFEPTPLNIERSVRSGHWEDIGTQSGTVSAKFVQASVKHAADQQDYGYVLLPNATQNDLIAFASDSPVKVLQQNEQAHVVKIQSEKTVLANVWAATPVQLTPQLTVEGKMALALKKEKGWQQVAVADPTQKQQQLTLTFNKPIRILDDSQKRIRVKNKRTVLIDVSGLKGQSYRFNVK